MARPSSWSETSSGICDERCFSPRLEESQRSRGADPAAKPPHHMPFDEFRRHGHELVDWVADYLETIERGPITADVKPGEIRAMLPETAPEQPGPFDDIVRDLNEIIVTGITH